MNKIQSLREYNFVLNKLINAIDNFRLDEEQMTEPVFFDYEGILFFMFRYEDIILLKGERYYEDKIFNKTYCIYSVKESNEQIAKEIIKFLRSLII